METRGSGLSLGEKFGPSFFSEAELMETAVSAWTHSRLTPSFFSEAELMETVRPSGRTSHVTSPSFFSEAELNDVMAMTRW